MKQAAIIALLLSLLTGCGAQRASVKPHVIDTSKQAATGPPTVVHRMMATCEGDTFEVKRIMFQPKNPGWKDVSFWVRKYKVENQEFWLEAVLPVTLYIKATEAEAPKILLGVGGVTNCKIWAQVLFVAVVE